MTDSDRGAWRLDIFAVERDGARLVSTGPWPAHGDPERAAFELGQNGQWPSGLYELRLLVGGEVRAWRKAALGFPAAPPPPAPPPPDPLDRLFEFLRTLKEVQL